MPWCPGGAPVLTRSWRVDRARDRCEHPPVIDRDAHAAALHAMAMAMRMPALRVVSGRSLPTG